MLFSDVRVGKGQHKGVLGQHTSDPDCGSGYKSTHMSNHRATQTDTHTQTDRHGQSQSYTDRQTHTHRC